MRFLLLLCVFTCSLAAQHIGGGDRPYLLFNREDIDSDGSGDPGDPTMINTPGILNHRLKQAASGSNEAKTVYGNLYNTTVSVTTSYDHNDFDSVAAIREIQHLAFRAVIEWGHIDFDDTHMDYTSKVETPGHEAIEQLLIFLFEDPENGDWTYKFDYVTYAGYSSFARRPWKNVQWIQAVCLAYDWLYDIPTTNLPSWCSNGATWTTRVRNYLGDLAVLLMETDYDAASGGSGIQPGAFQAFFQFGDGGCNNYVTSTTAALLWILQACEPEWDNNNTTWIYASSLWTGYSTGTTASGTSETPTTSVTGALYAQNGSSVYLFPCPAVVNNADDNLGLNASYAFGGASADTYIENHHFPFGQSATPDVNEFQKLLYDLQVKTDGMAGDMFGPDGWHSEEHVYAHLSERLLMSLVPHALNDFDSGSDLNPSDIINGTGAQKAPLWHAAAYFTDERGDYSGDTEYNYNTDPPGVTIDEESWAVTTFHPFNYHLASQFSNAAEIYLALERAPRPSGLR